MVKTGPPPIPTRPRSLARIDTEPEPPRIVRSRLVGRGDELATLREVIARAFDFQAPQLVTIVGNQGTGKTRLINELLGELKDSSDRKCRVIPWRGGARWSGQPDPALGDRLGACATGSS